MPPHTGLDGGEELGDVPDLSGELLRPSGRLLPAVAEEVPVVLHRRAAAGRVDGNDVAALEGVDELPGETERLRLGARVQHERPAAAGEPGSEDVEALRGEDVHRGLVD